MSPSDVVRLPEQFGRYTIVRKIGQGGMGAVYLARDTKLGRLVALKVCTQIDNARALERFKKEAKAAAGLRHPNICPVHDYDVYEGTAYITMAYIEGPPLHRWIEQHPLDARGSAVLVRTLALAMQEAHDRGVIHRDLKPSNIAIDQRGEPIVLDFGLARLAEARTQLVERHRRDASVHGAGTGKGESEEIGPATDVYALGVVLYELLTGEPPFLGPPQVIIGQLLVATPKPPRQLNPDVPPALEAICLQALAKKPSERFASMADFAEALAQVVQTVEVPKAVPLPVPIPPPGPPVTPPEVLPSTTFETASIPAGSEPTPPHAPPGAFQVPAPYVVNSVGMKLLHVKPGAFRMGSPETEQGRRPNEERHPVTLTRGYYLGETLVTQVQWKAVMGADHPSHFRGDELPVDLITWDDARVFCQALSQREGREYRLPTEAEWEYAARAGTTTPFWNGSTITTDQVNYDGNSPFRPDDPKGQFRGKTTPVKQFKPHPWGFYDLGGNLWQWCADWYGPYPSEAVVDPSGAPSGDARVVRGGSWDSPAWSCRAAYRGRNAPGDRSLFIGIRVAMTAPGVSGG